MSVPRRAQIATAILLACLFVGLAVSVTQRMKQPCSPPRAQAFVVPPAAGEGVLYRDREQFNAGSYIAYAAPWSNDAGGICDGLEQGVDFENTIRVFPDTFPNGTEISWHWPEPNGFIILNEFYLTRDGRYPTQEFEIANWLYSSAPMDFFNAGELVGEYVDDELRQWEVRNLGPNPYGSPYIVFRLQDATGAFSGTIDKKAMLDWLLSKQVITSDLYVGGSGLGTEPFNRYSVAGYMHLAYGDLAGGVPDVPVTPLQVANIAVFSETITVETSPTSMSILTWQVDLSGSGLPVRQGE